MRDHGLQIVSLLARDAHRVALDRPLHLELQLLDRGDNLNPRLGDQAIANKPVLALVDVDSYWVHGFFRETVIGNMRAGDRAIVTLMTYPHIPLEGRVESLGWGIAQQDGVAGDDLLPQISPTFEWIRLAQRVPIRIQLLDVPDGVALRVGTTASVLVLTGTADQDGDDPVAAAPRSLR